MTSLHVLLDAQRAAFLAEGGAPASIRIERLERCLDLLLSHEREICETVAADFGQRPAVITRFTEILPAVEALKHARRHVRRWMRPQRRPPQLPFRLAGVRTEIRYQALGVVGLISPWNFPINLTFCPLAGILAAGNRCLIKPSEFTPATSTLMQRLIAPAFDAREVAVVTGDARLAEAFANLPFDHLFFTGSTAVGRRVMAAAATNLVPVTLELGGKCPTVVGRSADVARAVDRILLGKLANAGQMCLAPDHVYVPREALDGFVRQARTWAARAYPGLPMSRDYTSMVSERHARRILDLIADARARGAEVIGLGPAAEPPGLQPRLIAPALVLRVSDEMQLMREEIFGPLLPLLPYDDLDEVVARINSGPRPLALYYFGNDRAEEDKLLGRTLSGGVTLNDVAMHAIVEDLPFGGVGASGMGAYHGEHGFLRFSHARAVYRQPRLDVSGLLGLRPPYGKRIERVLRLLIGSSGAGSGGA